MKKNIYLVYTVSLLLCFSCGGHKDNTPTSHAPTISNLNYFPKFSYVNYLGQNSQPVYGSIDFTDAGGDLSTMTLTTKTAYDSIISSTTIPIQNSSSGLHSGLLTVDAVVSTLSVTTIIFYVYITDRAGSRSNTLSGVFTVYQ